MHLPAISNNKINNHNNKEKTGEKEQVLSTRIILIIGTSRLDRIITNES